MYHIFRFIGRLTHISIRGITNDIFKNFSNPHIQNKTCKIITFIGRRNLIISWISAEQHITASHLTRINPRGKYQKNKSKFKKESLL